MSAIYSEVKTPYKYGMVVAPEDNYHKIDCPTVFNSDGKWYMTYVCYNGKDGLDGRGYETWLAESTDLLHWKTLGRVLSYKNSGWDMNQRGGFPSLIDWTWGGTYDIQKYKGRYWMTYLGGHGTGYEAVREPLNIGMAWTRDDITKVHEWQSADKPLLSINDKDVQWWEKLVQYKSTVYLDKNRTLGKKFVMFYNAGGINPENRMKAERIGIALSDNMKDWKRYDGNPVYFHESPGIITGDAQIVRMSVNGEDLFVMFYFSAYNPSRRYNAFNTFSVSRDLANWHDWTGSDLIYPTKPYDNMFAHKSYVMKHKGVVYHFYCAVNTAGQRGIAVATSVPMGKSPVAFPEPDKRGRRIMTDMDKGWRTRVIKSNQKLVYNEDEWHTVDLPHNFDTYYGYRHLKHGNLHGNAVYEKDFDFEKKNGKRYFMQFEGVGTYATVTLNGHQFNREGVGRTTYHLDITDYLQRHNHISVAVEHPELITDMPWVCGGCSSEWGFSEGSQPFGIYRPVTLVETDDVRIEPFGVHVWNNASCDSVFVDTEVKNYSSFPVEIELISKMNQASGKTYFRLPVTVHLHAGESKTIRQATAIADPHLWNLDDPYLYSLVSMIKRADKTTDEVTTSFGIRSVSWPVLRKDGDNCFYLNGKKVFINGTCDYEHLFGGSHAWSTEQISSRVKMMRQAGFNAFREAHQPHHLFYQQLLDQQGMLFWSQFSAHIWYDTPEFRANFKRYLRQYIRERRNSPSIILWGLQNESVLPKDFAEECSAIIREMDPTARDQRAITTCNGGEGTDWNVVQNWSGTYGGTPDNYANELKRPDQILNGEYGFWRTVGLHYSDAQYPAKKDYSEDNFARMLHKKATLAYSVRDSVCGHFQWVFASHENPGRIQPDESVRRIDKVGPFNYKGLITPWEQPTEGFFMYHDLCGDSTKDKTTRTAADMHPVSLKGEEGYHYLYRINCGGDAYTDRYGQTWLQDDSIYSSSWAQPFGLNPFTASQGHITDDIHGTEDDELFQFFRWGRDRLKYTFDVPDGDYLVELYFAEPWLGARYGAAADCEGQRLFSVSINDSVVIRDYDTWAEGGYAGALKRTVRARAKGGRLVISFPEVKAGEAVISAIAIASNKDVETVTSDIASGNMDSEAVVHEPYLRADYWHSLDKDTVAVYPKELLPQDSEAFPSVRYVANTQNKKLGSAVWTITPGIGREYMLRFRYKNTTGGAVVGRLKIVDSHDITLVDRDMTFPVTPDKFKTIGTTTGTQINAGEYKLTITGAKGLEYDYLEVQ